MGLIQLILYLSNKYFIFEIFTARLMKNHGPLVNLMGSGLKLNYNLNSLNSTI